MTIIVSYMFRHRAAILRESTKTKEYKSTALIYVLSSLTENIKVLKF